MFVVEGDTSRSHEIDEKRLHKELISSDRSEKPDNLSENTRVKQAHDGTGQPVERNSSSAHTVKEQFAPEENRDIASFNTDNEFNRAINEENIDFNIPGLPHSAVKQSHGVNVQNLIQKIENHPKRQALQSDLQQHRQFNPFSKESQNVIKAAGNIELCEVQSMSVVLGRRHCLLHVRALLARWNGREQEIRQVHSLFSIPNYYIKKWRPLGHRYGKKQGDHEYFIANSLKKKCKKRDFLGIHDRFIRDERFRKKT